MLQDANAWTQLGHEQLLAGNYGAALVFFTQALTLDPANADAWDGRATALQKLGSIQETISVSNEAIAEALYARGQELERQGLNEEAIKVYDRAIKLKREFSQAKQRRDKLIRRLPPSNVPLSIVFERPSPPSVLNNNFNPEFYWTQAEELKQLGRYEDAIPYYTKAIELGGNNSKPYIGLGNALRKLGHYEEAIENLNKAIELQPKDYIAYYYRGDIHKKLGLYEEAILDFTEVIKSESGYYNAYNSRGNVYRELELYQEAISDFSIAIHLQPKNHFAYNDRGCANRKLGLFEGAISDFKQALALSEDKNWRAWVNLGWIYFQDLCDYDNSWNIWNQGLQKLEDLKMIQPQDMEYQRGCGELFWSIGKAHYRYQLAFSQSRKGWDEPEKSYEYALKELVFERFPIRHLEVRQDLIQWSQLLKRPEDVIVLLNEATDLLRRLLETNQDESTKIRLSRKFASFNQMGVDVLVQERKFEAALELAENRKNLCLLWLSEGWKDSEESNLNYGQIEDLLNYHTAAIYWHISPSALTTFILKHKETPIVWTIKPENNNRQFLQLYQSQNAEQYTRFQETINKLEKLEKWIREWKCKYKMSQLKNTKEEPINSRIWRIQMRRNLDELSKLLDIEKITKYVSGIERLILIPHRDLHLLPLECLFPESFTITRLPSAKIGLDLQQQNPNSNPQLLSVENPRSDLPYATIESAAIALFHRDPDPKCIQPQEATKERVIQALQAGAGIFHFTGHAYHDLDQPEQSYLELDSSEQLTLKDIFKLRKEHNASSTRYRLVCLSACETGLTSKKGLSDEFVGLVSAFLAIGATHVISSLWRVDEISTALLMIEFHRLLKEEVFPALALKQTQKWLRTLTYPQLSQWYLDVANELASYDICSSEYLKWKGIMIQENSSKMISSDLPYAHPYYWAGFTITGQINPLPI